MSNIPSIVGLFCFCILSACAADGDTAPLTNAEYPTQVYWGDTDVHTTYSVDAVYTGRGQIILLEMEEIKRKTMKLRRLQHAKSAA